MNVTLPAHRHRDRGAAAAPERASILIIVLWIAFGLVSLALYFAQSMQFELRAADNRVAALQAEQAIAGAARYVSNILATAEVPGQLPDPELYEREAVQLGEGTFWLLDSTDWSEATDVPAFGLEDESGKLNLNSATLEMLQMLPWMTPELAAAIIDWRDTDSDVTPGGAEDEVYQRLSPPYRCKNGKFESVAELRLVYGMDLEVLLGEDTNGNGLLDDNENDADESPPEDNRDGHLDRGILAYVTVFSQEPNTRTNGSPRIDVSAANLQELSPLLQEKFGAERANQILARFGTTGGPGRPGGNPGGSPGGGATIRSVLEFYVRSGMTAEEFAEIEREITVSTEETLAGLVNPATASEAVLACLPGIGVEQAPAIVAYRQGHALESLRSLAWISEVLEQTNAIAAGPYLTSASYQFRANVAAVGRHGRGYQRVEFVFDTSEGTPAILYRRDLTHLGWALGRDARADLLLAQEKRR